MRKLVVIGAAENVHQRSRAHIGTTNAQQNDRIHSVAQAFCGRQNTPQFTSAPVILMILQQTIRQVEKRGVQWLFFDWSLGYTC